LSSQLELVAPSVRDVSIITHSVGGIISQLALKDGRENGYGFPGKTKKLIMAGQPGQGSPTAEVYTLFLRNIASWTTTTSLFGAGRELWSLAVEGLQVDQNPGTEYYVVFGTKDHPLTTRYFTETNDAIVASSSANRVANKDLRSDLCEYAWPVQENHPELGRAQGSAQTIENLLSAPATGELKPGQLRYLDINIGNCNGETIVVCGNKISPEAAYDPSKCKCGNGVCGLGEDGDSCPADCAPRYPVYLCTLAPWVLGPLVGILLILTTISVANAIRKHERTKAGAVTLGLGGLTAAGMVAHYALCGFTMPLAGLALGFALSVLGLTYAHLGRHKPGMPKTLPPSSGKPLINEDSIQQMERWLEQTKKKIGRGK
jgi:hypothetical protein